MAPKRTGRRRVVLAGFAACLIAGGALGWLRWQQRPAADPLAHGIAAYDRGDYAEAERAARTRLKTAGDDPGAVRLLARVSVRLGHDSTAQAIYGRLDDHAMTAEDLCLQGISAARDGNREHALTFWERAQAADPDHAETLFELTRAYYLTDRLAPATATGHRLAALAGWEARGEVFLGMTQSLRGDPDGAVAAWRRALEHEAAARIDASASLVPRKELARGLLQAGRPADALSLLLELSPADCDAECFWLRSRGYLQEGAIGQALEAWEKGKSFRDDHPIAAEPAGYVGAAMCKTCHAANFHAHERSRHARTFARPTEVTSLELPVTSLADPAAPRVTHSLAKDDLGVLHQETTANGRTIRAVVDYAFGSGDRGLTLVGHDEKGAMRELRLSSYRTGLRSGWDVTFGQQQEPFDTELYLGQPLEEDAVRKCLFCHVTNPWAVLTGNDRAVLDKAIGCERCHGPAGNHLLAVAARFPEPAIGRPALVSGAPLVKLCGQCHSPRGREVVRGEPAAVRFQAATLTWSRCFTESDNRLDCVTCHNPHRDAETKAEHYEAKCLACHAGTKTPAGRRERLRGARLFPGQAVTPAWNPCPVNPLSGCLGCHMPSVQDAVPHSAFTDHFIRVHRD
jgi:Flp pilus assembly protein TadD